MKPKLSEWASIGEIIASLAVVISLLFVFYGINQNTKALQANSDNFLYDLQNQRLRAISSDGELAEIIVKFDAGMELTEAETVRYRTHLFTSINMWEVAFIRFRENLMPPRQWESWDGLWAADIPIDFPEEWWASAKYGYDDEFVAHVDAAYSNR